MTTLAIQDSLAAWIPQVQGQYINEDWNPHNKGFGAQCWDLAANWSKFLGLPVINTGYPGKWVGWAGNMVSAYPQTPEIAAAYELIGPDQSGLGGDIAVWDDSWYHYPATHVAVLVRDSGPQLLCMSQNSVPARPDNPYPEWSTGPTTLQYLPRRGLLGFLRPRAGLTYQGTTTQLQEDFLMALSEQDQIEIRDNLRKLVGSEAAQDTYAEGMNEKLDEIVGNVRKTFWNTQEAKIILTQTPAPQLAQAIDAAGLAAEVRDELVKLLGGN